MQQPQQPQKSLYTKIKESEEAGVLTFGKYKGKSLIEIEDAGYIAWYQQHNNKRLEICEMVPDWGINFGKYKGSAYKHIVEMDPSYAEWLIGIVRSNYVAEYLKMALKK